MCRRVGGFAVRDGLLIGDVLRNQTLIELGLGQCAAANQHLAKAHVVFRQLLDQFEVFGELAVRRQNAQFAVVTAEIEDALDIGFG